MDLPPTWRKTGVCSPQLPHSPPKSEHLCLLSRRPKRHVNLGRIFSSLHVCRRNPGFRQAVKCGWL
eukprot:4103766-Prymnesium_polylepis.2